MRKADIRNGVTPTEMLGFFVSLLFPFNLYFPLLFRIVQATTLYSGQSFGVADAGGDIV
jgi:hypothetical protein